MAVVPKPCHTVYDIVDLREGEHAAWYGVISMTATNPEADNDNGFGEDQLLYEDGKPRMVWIFNLDGTQYLAYNRVWQKRITTGTWDVSETTLVTKVDDPDAPESTFEIVSFERMIFLLCRQKMQR